MRHCSEFLPLLEALADQSLPQADESALIAHLTECAECRSWLDRRRRLSARIRTALEVPDPGDDYFQDRRERLLEAATVRPPRRATGLRRFVAISALLAASFLIVVLGPGLLRKATAPERIPSPSVPDNRPTQTAKGPPIPEPRPLPPPPSHPEPERAHLPPAPPAPEPRPVPVPTPLLPPPPPVGPAPGSADRLARMTKEAVEIALAETPVERVSALCSAAEAQLEELRRILDKNPSLAAELAAAYRILLREGVSMVLRDPSEPAEELAAAREIASRRARNQEAMLLALGGGTSGALKQSLSLALEASRELLNR